MLDVRRLRILCEVARRGSFSGAADALSYTPSAVSQQIATLEREAGVILVERRARGVVLTEAGLVLVGHAEIVLAGLAAAEGALAELSALRTGHLRLASFATAGATIVPGAVDAFRARYPAVEVRVEQAASAEGVLRVRQGRLDLALCVDHGRAAGVEIVQLFRDPFRLALHRNHPLADVGKLGLAHLAGERWIDVPGDPTLARACARVGIEHHVAFESDDYTAIHELVGVGLGVALLPDLALFPANDNVVLRSLGADGPFRRIQAATRPAPLRSPPASAMLHILKDLEPRRRPPAPHPQPAQPVACAVPSR